MNKPNLHAPMTFQENLQPVVSTLPSLPLHAALENSHRLIVLLPEDVDCNSAKQRIWELAQAGTMPIQLLGMYKDPGEALGFRRRLVTMASLMQAGRTQVDIKVSPETNWMDAVQTVYEPGDVIVCFADQRTGLLHRPLSQVLESNFKTTVYILSDPDLQRPAPNLLAQMRAWLGFLGIMIGFGLLQAKIVQLPQGWFQSILLILSILPELWLIWVWNRQSG
jgi:hypothetical protein